MLIYPKKVIIYPQSVPFSPRMPGLLRGWGTPTGVQPNFGNARVLGAYGPPTPPLFEAIQIRKQIVL